MSTINERFREVRKVLGLSQDDFAARANRTRSEISNIEYNKTTPKEEVIKSVCKIHGISEDWLRHGIGAMMVEKSEEEKTAAMVAAVLDGPPDFTQAVVKMICSRTPEDLAALERAFLDVYNSIKKE